MSKELCFSGICFIHLDGNGQKFFGFSEFLAGLALMVLAWTTADIRYRFRVRVAPVPLLGITFSIVAVVGVLTLLTDLWRAEQWLVPKGNLISPAEWQAILGGLFFLTFLTWTWFAFIRPPIYGRLNAKRFAQTLYQFIVKGSPEELTVIADELASSARAIVWHATNFDKFKTSRLDRKNQEKALFEVEGYANDLLSLIADKRLCRSIIESSPFTALAIFQAVTDLKKYGVQIGTFANNILNEALANKNSFLYHETDGYESGLIGHHKPLSQSIFADYEMVETIGTSLDLDIYGKQDFDASQWEAYCRVVLMTFSSYVKQGYETHSFALYRAKGYIENAVSDLYTLNEISRTFDSEPARRLRVVIDFVKNAVKILNAKGVSNHIRIRVREKHGHPRETFYDHIASMIFEVIFHASTVKSPQWECWAIQYNSVWSELFSSNLDGCAGFLVKFKVRRLLYDEITYMKTFPNFKGAKILGFCLNVMGLTIRQGSNDRDSQALQKAVLSWTKKHFLWLHEYNSRVAEECLINGITYDAINRRLVRAYPAEGLRRESSFVYLALDATI